MYIEKTTAAERLTIRQAVDGSFVYIMRARRILERVLDGFFMDAEQKPISRNDAESIGDILQAVNDALWWAETEYSLTVGDETAPGCPSCYEGASRAALVRDVERLRDKLRYADTDPYLDLEDEKALPVLQEIAKQKGAALSASAARFPKN